MKAAVLTRAAAVGCLAVAACSSDGDTGLEPPNLACVRVTAIGETDGDRDVLSGVGVFRFGDVERRAQASLYLFEMKDVEGGLLVETLYQFNWDEGDQFLTSDRVLFEPRPGVDKFEFTVEMTIVAAAGTFADMVGDQPLSLTATIEFGPPVAPGEPKSAAEEFTIDGKICPQ